MPCCRAIVIKKHVIGLKTDMTINDLNESFKHKLTHLWTPYFYKAARNKQWKKKALSINCAGKTVCLHVECKYFHIYYPVQN